MVLSSSGLGYLVLIQKIAGSNPARITIFNMKKFIKKQYQYFGILSLLAASITVFYGIIKIHLSVFSNSPISYLGVSSVGHIFTIGMCLSAFLMIPFLFFLYDTYKLSRSFFYIFSVAIISLALVGIFPEKIGNKIGYVHWISAWLLVVLIFLDMKLFFKETKDKFTVGKISNLLANTLIIILLPEIILAVLQIESLFSQLLNIFIVYIWIFCLIFYKERLAQEQISH